MRHGTRLAVTASFGFLLALFAACSSSSPPAATTDAGGGSSGGGSGSGSGGGSSGGGSGSGSSGGGGSGGSSSGSSDGGRTAATCAQIQTQSATAGYGFEPGSWGPIPTALQSLPAGATLCGTQSMGDASVADNDFVIIDSPLTGQALANFYTPLAQGMGCTLDQSAVASLGVLYSCPNSMTFAVVPNSVEAYLSLTYGE